MRKFFLAAAMLTLCACGSGGSGPSGSLSSDPDYPNENPTNGVSDPVSPSTEEPGSSPSNEQSGSAAEPPGCAGQEDIGIQELFQAMEASYCGLATRCSETSSAKLFSSLCDGMKAAKSQPTLGNDIRIKPGTCKASVSYCLGALQNIGCEMTKTTKVPGCEIFESSSQDTGTKPPDTSSKCSKCVTECGSDVDCIQACYEPGSACGPN